MFVFTVLILCLIPATRYYQFDVPLLKFFRGSRQVDPLSLHLAGEFVENNLGTRQDADGSVTVRMIAEQYLFIPHCVVVPAGVPVHLRITSADAVHSLVFNSPVFNSPVFNSPVFNGMDSTLEVLPGTISVAQLQFDKAGEYKTKCGEFCGAGHYAMRSEWKVVPRDQFAGLLAAGGLNCAAQ
jgi:cytochrome c oxidase subunit 2